MLRYVLMVAGIVGFASALGAQDTESQAKADSLREVLQCPTDVEWLDLPVTGRQVFRSMQLDSVGSAAPVDPEQFARPDIGIPQYAYYYEPHYSRCMAVIIVQAEGRAVGFIGVSPPPPAAGGANEEFFDLLGTQPSASESN